MLDGDIRDHSLAAEKPAGAFVERYFLEESAGFEDVEEVGLGGRGKAGFGGFVVFEDDGGVGDGVGFGGEEAGGSVVGLLLFDSCFSGDFGGIDGVGGGSFVGVVLRGEGASGAFGLGWW